MIVDILVPQGKRGGVENLIIQLAEYVKEKSNWKIRVIQLVNIGAKWVPDDVDYTALNDSVKTEDASFFASQYANFLLQRGLPDIILASVWPFMSVVSKLAIQSLKPSNYIPIVYWAHAPIYVYEKAGYGRFSHIALSDVQLAISDFIYNEISSHLNDSNILPVKNPAKIPDENQMVSREMYTSNISKKYNLLFVGRIAGEKNIETVIEAIKMAPNWTLTVVGTGEDDYVATINELIEKENVKERVIFCGWKKNPWECAKEGDYLILPSLFEGFSLTTIEALSLGIPVICTAVGVTIEVVKPGKTGYFFEMMNSVQLSELLQNIESGAFPAIDPYECREVVKRYDSNLVFLDFCAKVEEILLGCKSSISEKFAKCYLYEDDKISIILSVDDSDREFIEKCLCSITHQTIPLRNIEIIIASNSKLQDVKETLYKYEKEYSENILIINVDDCVSKQELMNIAFEYCSGNFYFPMLSPCELNFNILDSLYRKIKLYSCDVALSVGSQDNNVKEIIGYVSEESSDNTFVNSDTVLYSKEYIRNSLDLTQRLPVGTKYAYVNQRDGV